MIKALTAYGERNFNLAISYFERYMHSSGMLRDYVYLWWGSCLKEMGKDTSAIKFYTRVQRNSPVRKKAVQEMVSLYKKRSDWRGAFRLIKERLALEKNKKLLPPLQKEAIEICSLSRDPAPARDIFKTLLRDFPETKDALDVLERYGDFYSYRDDELDMARVYLSHREFKKALREMEGRENFEALRLKAEVLCGLRDYNSAVAILEKLVNEKDDDNMKLRLGELYLITSKEKGISLLEKLAVEREGGNIAALSIWDLLNYWKGNGDEEKMKLYSGKLRACYREFSLTDKAIWMEGWMEMKRKNFSGADKIWQDFDGITRRSREKLSALYLRGWMSSNSEEAGKISERLATIYPDTYYGLQALEGILHPRVPVSIFESEELREEEDFERAKALAELGRHEETILELEALKEKRYNDINLRYNLSLIYGKANKFYEAINEAESLVDYLRETGKWPGFFYITDRNLLEINFPRFYREEVEKRAGEFKLDENLIYAVIREESRFNEKDVSASGAIGLMQIMPSTAAWIMGKTGPQEGANVPGGGEELFNPGVNIFLGSWYLRYLLDKFKGDLLLTIASYNGGPGLIERWVKEGGATERDIAIEMMPREETKYYCQKVLFSFYMYKMIYGGVK